MFAGGGFRFRARARRRLPPHPPSRAVLVEAQDGARTYAIVGTRLVALRVADGELLWEREVGEVISTLPAPGEAPESQIHFSLLVAAQVDRAALLARLDFEGAEVCEVRAAP